MWAVGFGFWDFLRDPIQITRVLRVSCSDTCRASIRAARIRAPQTIFFTVSKFACWRATGVPVAACWSTPRFTEKGVQNQLSLVRGDLFGSVQTNVKFMSTTPQSHRRPADNGLDRHVGAVIAFAVVAIACTLYTMVVTLSAINTLVFALLGLVAGACAVTMMESGPHQEALSTISHAMTRPPVPPPSVAGTHIRRDVPNDLLAIVRLVRIVDGEATSAL